MTEDAPSYRIHPDNRALGVGIGIFFVGAVFAAFGWIRGLPGALIAFGVCFVAIVVIARLMAGGSLTFDERGIVDDAGDETIPWPEVADLGIVERPGRGESTSAFLEVLRIDGEQIQIPIAKLEATPMTVLQRANEVRNAHFS